MISLTNALVFFAGWFITAVVVGGFLIRHGYRALYTVFFYLFIIPIGTITSVGVIFALVRG